MKQTIEIDVPEGYELKKCRYTGDTDEVKEIWKLVKKPYPMTWDEIPEVTGWVINSNSSTIEESNVKGNSKCLEAVFKERRYAEAAIAAAKITQLMPYYGGTVAKGKLAYPIVKSDGKPEVKETPVLNAGGILRFNSKEQAHMFLAANNLEVLTYINCF